MIQSSLFKKIIPGFSEFEDPVLRNFGVAIAIAHLLTIIFYLQFSVVEIFRSPFPICWPFLPNCYAGPAWSQNAIYAYLIFYGAAALLSAVAFLSGRIRVGWILSFATLLLKLILFFKDYRMMGNYHYMIHIIHLLFLFYPLKRKVIPMMLVAIYVSAGALKFNFEWLSGAALLTEPMAKGGLLVAMCTYVVILEMIVSFGLLSKNRNILRLSLAQFFIFHVFSYGQVGFFYPCVMLSLLSIFYLPILLRRDGFRFSREKLAVQLAPLFLFAAAQLAPLAFVGDSSLTGQGRIFSLNMFDARSECLIEEIARFDLVSIETNPKFSYVRIHCDPVTVIGLERAKCAALKKVPGFRDLDVYVNSKKQSGEARPILRIENFCDKNPEFNIWKHNDFIL
ncbi:hypothetical protein BH10BDE1_BH10BDE1_30750 [soil metagenome]